MNLAISNFAWENINQEFVFNNLKKNDIHKIECVLTKIASWDKLNDELIINYKNELNKYEIEPYSIQSLFYNITCDSLSDKKKVLAHFERLIKYSKILGAKVLVLGSPNLRIFSEHWKDKLIDVFRNIDDMLNGTDTKLVIEPNCSMYGGDYFKTLGEIIFFLDLNEFNNIKTMIDTHNSLLENSDPIFELTHFFDYIEHIHISELKLEPIKDLDFHKKFSETIKKYFYNKTITYELGNYPNFEDSIKIFSEIYG